MSVTLRCDQPNWLPRCFTNGGKLTPSLVFVRWRELRVVGRWAVDPEIRRRRLLAPLSPSVTNILYQAGGENREFGWIWICADINLSRRLNREVGSVEWSTLRSPPPEPDSDIDRLLLTLGTPVGSAELLETFRIQNHSTFRHEIPECH